MSELNEIANRAHDQVAAINRVTLFPATSKRVIDESGAPATTYIAVTAPGTATSASGWFIERITVSGATTTIEHATGVYNDRASLSYT